MSAACHCGRSARIGWFPTDQPASKSDERLLLQAESRQSTAPSSCTDRNLSNRLRVFIDGIADRFSLLTAQLSEISKASSTSTPRCLTVDSSLEWPSRNCTARKFFVRR
jgi:hypothetical protein